MKKGIILIIFCVLFFVDFIFFDYQLSDIKHIKEDTSELTKYVEGSMKLDFPVFFEKNKIYIKTCKEYYQYLPVPVNGFEKEAIRNIKKRCALLSILKNVNVSRNSFIETVNLSDYNHWNKDLFFRHYCEKKFEDIDEYNDYMNYDEKFSKYKTTKDLINADLLIVKVFSPKEIEVVNKITEQTFRVKEIFRANFDQDKNRDILVEISFLSKDNNYVSCTEYAVFSNLAENGIIEERVDKIKENKIIEKIKNKKK